MKIRLWLLAAVLSVAAFVPNVCEAGKPYRVRWGSAPAGTGAPWAGSYNHTAYGAPVALVVPPSVERYGSYSWGMPASHTHYLPEQFTRSPYGAGGSNYGAYGYGGVTPVFPSSSGQFGVYYVRGPWW